MKALSLILAVFFIFTTAIQPQTDELRKMHSLSGKVGITLEGGATYTRSDFKTAKFDYIGKFWLEYFFPTSNFGAFSIKGFAGLGRLAGEKAPAVIINGIAYTQFKTPIQFAGGGLAYYLEASEEIFPYGFVGASYLHFTPQDGKGNKLPRFKNNKYSPNEYMINGELGVRFLVDPLISVNLGVGLNWLPTDDIDDLPNSLTGGTDKDIFFNGTLGVSFYLGGIEDSDEDGVSDPNDLCPNTPFGVRVDAFGCPIDSDKDGVANYLDECPNTPLGIPVDENGCPVDADEDGVPDYLDICKDTPEGVPVDKRGCPFDTDEDGVPDYRDKCPNTPIGKEVDRWGCVVEPEVTKAPEITKLVLSAGMNFETGKSDLLPGAKRELDKIISVIRENPDTRWRIEGHTDNTGSRQLNMRLSLARANSVLNYLIQNGLDRNRFDIAGLGPDYPVAENNTESGRAMNRRVTIEMITGATDVKVSDNLPSGYNAAAERNVGSMIFFDGRVYCFQVSSWREKFKAEREAEKLRTLGFNSFVLEARIPELDGIWYRVRVGFFDSLSEAKEVRARVLR
jgi:outer membrane protein OmpA-like peptidoglycan-associated protein